MLNFKLTIYKFKNKLLIINYMENLLELHSSVYKKLDYFIKNNKIPHIIFYGPQGSGKRKVLNDFINKIYNSNNNKIKQYVMYVNCAHNKGIRFIRDELKFFAKTNIHNNESLLFKSIVLFNAEKLTIDAQSALRRCIEKFSYNTRFFILVENESGLLKPILSRFCNIYIDYPIIFDKKISLHKYNKKNIINKSKEKKKITLKNILKKKENFKNIIAISKLTNKLYEKGFSGLDILEYIENLSDKDKYLFLIYFNKVKNEFRNEKLFIFFILKIYFMRKNVNLENILSV